MVRRIIFAISLGACFGVQADVPYQFSNGQVADANEVNANFNDLDERLDSLASDQEQAHEEPDPVHQYSRNPIETSPGERYTIAGQEYISIEVPFADPSSGKRYALLVPMPSCQVSGNERDCNNQRPRFRITVAHTNTPTREQFRIDGFPASLSSNADSWTYRTSLRRDDVDSPYKPYWVVEYYERVGLAVGVGAVRVSTSIELPGSVATRKTIEKSELSEFRDSYSGVVDWGAVSEHRLDTQAMEAIVNRVHIREL